MAFYAYIPSLYEVPEEHQQTYQGKYSLTYTDSYSSYPGAPIQRSSASYMVNEDLFGREITGAYGATDGPDRVIESFTYVTHAAYFETSGDGYTEYQASRTYVQGTTTQSGTNTVYTTKTASSSTSVTSYFYGTDTFGHYDVVYAASTTESYTTTVEVGAPAVTRTRVVPVASTIEVPRYGWSVSYITEWFAESDEILCLYTDFFTGGVRCELLGSVVQTTDYVSFSTLPYVTSITYTLKYRTLDKDNYSTASDIINNPVSGTLLRDRAAFTGTSYDAFSMFTTRTSYDDSTTFTTNQRVTSSSATRLTYGWEDFTEAYGEFFGQTSSFLGADGEEFTYFPPVHSENTTTTATTYFGLTTRSAYTPDFESGVRGVVVTESARRAADITTLFPYFGLMVGTDTGTGNGHPVELGLGWTRDVIGNNLTTKATRYEVLLPGLPNQGTPAQIVRKVFVGGVQAPNEVGTTFDRYRAPVFSPDPTQYGFAQRPAVLAPLFASTGLSELSVTNGGQAHNTAYSWQTASVAVNDRPGSWDAVVIHPMGVFLTAEYDDSSESGPTSSGTTHIIFPGQSPLTGKRTVWEAVPHNVWGPDTVDSFYSQAFEYAHGPNLLFTPPGFTAPRYYNNTSEFF